MLAAAYGSLDAFKLLLDSGADANAVSEFGVTALHWAVGDAKKAQLLLNKGVDVNAKSQIGRTPLMIAAGTHGASAVVKALLAKGAQTDTADVQGITPLIAASTANDPDSVRALLDRGANANAQYTAPVATPLMSAAANGSAEIVRLLLAHKADPNAVSGPASGQVKNGPIALGLLTPLHWAAVGGDAEVTRLILNAGAKIDLADVRGMTALMSSVASDHANPAVTRMLLEKGSNPAIRSKVGETTLDWARKFNNPAILSLLKLSPESVSTAAIKPVADSAGRSPKEAVERALPPLQRATDYVFKDSGCVACHAQPVTEMAASLARARGWRVDPDLSRQSMDSMRVNMTSNLQSALQGREGGGVIDGLLYTLLALDMNKVPSNAGTDAAVYYLMAKQRTAGNWQGFGGTRAPIQDGDFTRTAMAIRALSVHGMPGRKLEVTERIARAAGWLASQTPASTEYRTMQLLGLHWANAEPKLKVSLTQELLVQQRPDGGWAQTPFLGSDAYATGQVLYTLHELGTPSSDPAFQRGVEYLLRTQKADGTWFVKNRAMKLQPYFESGFPYEHDQWISASATAWAIMALSLSELQPASVASR
jgi:ankyrin repeat protein